MSAPDIAILVIVAASTLYGLYRGGVKEIFSILAILVGIAGGMYLHGPVGGALGGSGIARVISFIVIFMVITFVVNKIGHAIRASLKLAFLGGIDRLIGTGVGFLRGVVIVGVIWALAATYMNHSERWMRDSRLAPPALKVVEALSPMFPKALKDQFEGRYKEVEEYWKEAKKRMERVQENVKEAEALKEELEKKREALERVKGD